MIRYSPEEIQRRRAAAADRFRRYAEEVLLPVLGAAGPADLRAPGRGLGSLLYFVGAAGAPPLVLRGEPGRRPLARRIAAHAFLLRQGFPVPAVLYQDLSFLSRLRWGYYFMAERRLEGTPYQDLPDRPRAAFKVGRLFARLHQIRGRAPGGFLPPWNGLERQLHRNTREWLERYKHGGCPEVERVAAWVASWPPECWKHWPRLCMGDIAPTNVLVHGEETSLVDLSGVGFGSAPYELARTRHKLLGDHDDAWASFLDGYLESADPSQHRELEGSLRLWDGLQRIRQAGRYTGPRREHQLKRLFEVLAPSP